MGEKVLTIDKPDPAHIEGKDIHRAFVKPSNAIAILIIDSLHGAMPPDVVG